jgi:hypothetical protein
MRNCRENTTDIWAAESPAEARPAASRVRFWMKSVTDGCALHCLPKGLAAVLLRSWARNEVGIGTITGY